MLISMRALLLALACGLIVPAPAADAPSATPTAPVSSAASTTSTAEPTDLAVELEYERLLELDDAALQEVDRWILEEQAQRNEGLGLSDVTLKARIFDRFRPVRQAYEDFLKKHPRHARARLAYGSFLAEIGDEELAVEQMEKSRELDPTNPAAWNNLANHYGHRGPVKKAFEYYAKAIELNPVEPIYYQNLGVAVFVFRKDAAEFYSLDEPAVFEKSLDLYRQAMKLAPDDFLLASDYAVNFYGMLPMGKVDPEVRAEQTARITTRAIKAWEDVLQLAADDLQREGVLIHIARNRSIAGDYAQSKIDLASVTNQIYQEHKNRLLRNISEKENPTSPEEQPSSPEEHTTPPEAQPVSPKPQPANP